jgi:hypothetical protein
MKRESKGTTITAAIRQNTVGEHGWWQACAEIGASGYDPFGPEGANFNLLIVAACSIRSAGGRGSAPISTRSGALLECLSGSPEFDRRLPP